MSRGKSNRLKLLVVDDETDNLDLLYRTFRRDFRVYKAQSAHQALEVLEERGEMGIIISDQRMPEMNGTEFLSKTVDRFPDTIRILLTGFTDVEDLVDAINSGQVFKYITKPWNPEELKAVVGQAAETYGILKQRTNELNRSLRRESLFNDVMSASREETLYSKMLPKIIETVGKSFAATGGKLYPVEGDGFSLETFLYLAPNADEDIFSIENLNAIDKVRQECKSQLVESQSIESENGNLTQLVVPLVYQQDLLAVLALYQVQSNEPWSPDDVNLIESVAEQAALALSQARLYQRTQDLVEKMRAELDVARQIQSNLLRQTMPESETENVQACCYPALEVGGDFFEVFVHPQGDLWLALGDVSGKGVPAALFMASTMSVMRRELSLDNPPDPEIVMQNLNHGLADDLISNNCFITMVLARYTPSTRQLVYANAGHIYPLVWSHKDVAERAGKPSETDIEHQFLKTRGIPLGILPVWKAKSGSLTLASGDVFLLTSDGLTEATVTEIDSSGEEKSVMLQQEGLWKLLQLEPSPLDLSRLLNRVREKTQEQEDDQTILSLEVL
ncbi:SpoIIE family protein phosphatase [Oscillatoriales cyanobacterium LEGE 11467]|uniref:SpoIIE family protein phosphatase n=1 Tax=Zarconia navalis LEGE 11467 TaxID=1828826 RepID=A0A928Z9M8_9CYAN|nr:SpoIIE family protein phosphatase [Zarconia navalis]MBE9041843.1 SpoIIE family protein phosphatase [Zarconia navalis LEGE 11467]